MRVEPYGIGSILHIVQRGARGTEIVRDMYDQKRFVRSLFYLNNVHSDKNWHTKVSENEYLTWPIRWPDREPLVRILAWTLLSNHFHLLIQELRDGGVAKFMQRLGGSMSVCFNTKYHEQGSLFQSSYRARVVSNGEHHQYLAFYILVKNVLEMYPGGLFAARDNFDDAWKWAKQYPYSSFRDTVSSATSPIIDDEEKLIGAIIGTGDTYKQEARELLDFHIATKGDSFKGIMLEQW